MFPAIWENFSPYFVISVLLSIVCLFVTYFLKLRAKDLALQHEVPDIGESKVKTLAQTKPLLLAKEIENKLPDHVKVIEKRYSYLFILIFCKIISFP